MNRILNEIRKIIDKNMALYLPHVKSSDLENDGAIFYMNAQNGTEFDWFISDRFPFFMVFYQELSQLIKIKRKAATGWWPTPAAGWGVAKRGNTTVQGD